MLEIEMQNSKIKEKKKGSSWPLLALLGGGIAYWIWNKKKKEKAQALALATQARVGQLRAQQQRTSPQKQPSATNSAEARLLGMGEDWKGANPTSRQEWREG